MASAPTRGARLNKGQWAALTLAAFVGVISGALHLFEPLDLALSAFRDKMNARSASGEIVLVAVDDRSVAALGPLPWKQTVVASAVRRVLAAGPRMVHLDGEIAAEDQNNSQLRAVLAVSNQRVTLAARVSTAGDNREQTRYLPNPHLTQHASVLNTNVRVEWDGSIRRHFYKAPFEDKYVPTLASRLGRVSKAPSETFPINLAIDVSSIPTVSLLDILDDRVPATSISGKAVVFGRTDLSARPFWTGTQGVVPAAKIHILAAETLLIGEPLELSWFVPLVFSLSGVALIITGKRRRAALTAAGSVGGLLLTFLVLPQRQIYVDVLPGIAALLIAAATRWAWEARAESRRRAETNPITGLPNLQALRRVVASSKTIVVAARVKNYASVSASLPTQSEKDMVDQIVARLSFGARGSDIYQLDDGHFVWIAHDVTEELVSNEVEGLHALFRSPVVIGDRLIDLTVAFGLDADTTRPLVQRTSSAFVAADEASRAGKRLSSFNPATLANAEWDMSLLTRLDRAIEANELWVAYQPKLDLVRGEITGAEALVRWTHPTRGDIYPNQFIPVAEEGGRIAKLTYYVLDRALEAANAVSSGVDGFDVAVNLSAAMLAERNLADRVSELLEKHGVSPSRLTLEITETSALSSAQEARAILSALVGQGIKLSIDDYGTGFSTLEYLRSIPAVELKIDRSFVSMLHGSQSDRIVVNSTIQLAHSLDRRVVAEGVENQEILKQLREMGCDLAQGYFIARPMPLPQLVATLVPNSTSAQAA